MKNLSLLVWLTQLALSVVTPLVGFIWLGVWLQSRYHWGAWIILVCVALGVIFAIDGLRYSLKLMARLAKNETEETQKLSFNDHE